MLNIEQQIFKQIEKAKDILVVFPAGPEGDGLASALAFSAFLKKIGRQVSIAGLRPEKERRHLSFLPGYDSIMDSLAISDALSFRSTSEPPK
jgi:nanoRNase/pAp phosphatase (c-di-AMP/oligoRNAs hydrolase)